MFDTNRFLRQPAHPNCRCTSVVAWPLAICGGEMGAKDAAEPVACIIPLKTIEEQAKARAAEDAKPRAAFDGGQIADLNTLSVKQLQTLTRQNGVSIARTRADFIKLLNAAEPGIDHKTLQGASMIDAKLKQHKIGLLQNKQQLVKAVEKAAGEELAEKARMEAVEAAKK